MQSATKAAAKHTQGPWECGHIANDEHPCNCTSIVSEGYAGGIATVHVDNGIAIIAEGGNDCPPLEEAKANSRLIAAAPELYDFVDRISKITDIGQSADEDARLLVALRGIATRLISKAEGAQ